jgi:hypothetical protein
VFCVGIVFVSNTEGVVSTIASVVEAVERLCHGGDSALESILLGQLEDAKASALPCQVDGRSRVLRYSHCALLESIGAASECQDPVCEDVRCILFLLSQSERPAKSVLAVAIVTVSAFGLK